jgi:hypothetical protein
MSSLAASVDMTASDRGLASCLKQAGVHQDVITHIRSTIKLESLEDFFHYFTGAAYETECESLVNSVESTKDNRLVVARLRAAYVAAKEAISAASLGTGLSRGSVDELEAPVPQHAYQQMEQDFAKVYGLTIDVNLQPADGLLGRVWREFRRKSATVIEVRKMRSVLQDKIPPARDSVPLPQGARIEFEFQAELSVTSLIQYYFCLRTLAYAWAMAGNYDVESVQKPGSQVRMMNLTSALDYADKCLRLTLEYGGQCRQWLESRDILTRGRMVTLMRRGWPAVEALTAAWAESHLDWRARDTHQVPRERSSAKKHPRDSSSESRTKRQKKAQSTVSTLPGGKTFCKPWNDERGCKVKNCPKIHGCDIRLPSGKACNSVKHTRVKHP